jgi:hypothetical protein
MSPRFDENRPDREQEIRRLEGFSIFLSSDLLIFCKPVILVAALREASEQSRRSEGQPFFNLLAL